jgi:hypothetical protein
LIVVLNGLVVTPDLGIKIAEVRVEVSLCATEFYRLEIIGNGVVVIA